MFKSLPTLKSLPQAIGLPFLSTHEDAQVAFKAGDNGIKRLYGEDTIPISEDSYWSQYRTLFHSAADVYSLITAQDIRQTLAAAPQNLAALVTSLSSHLFVALPSPGFPHTGAREALNCLRVLSRILVVVYEAEADAREVGIPPEATWAGEYLWKQVSVARTRGTGVAAGHDAAAPRAGSEEPQFTLEDSDDEDDEGVRAFKATVGNPMPAPKEDDASRADGEIRDPLANPVPSPGQDDGADGETDADVETLPCLADRLFSCVIDLLFCAGFTVPESVRGQDGSGDKINYVIWEKGVGSTVNIGTSPELDRNKVEVLRFLLILLSSTIYTPPHALATTPNVPLGRLTHALERRLVLSLLCSLLNTSLASPKAGAVGAVPYNHLVFKASDERRELVRGCLMTLLVALDSYGDTAAEGASADDNAFRYFLSKLDDFAFVLGGILGILEEQISVTNNYLPGAKKPVPYILETFMLLWRLVDLNKVRHLVLPASASNTYVQRFRTYLFSSGKAIDVIGTVLICCLEYKDDPAQHGLLRLLSYLLQTLSADPGFANAINQPLRQTVPAKWAVQGSAADFMIVSIYSIATTPGLNPLFPALTISIANVAPQLRRVGVQASTRLLQLFKAFSAPNFLLADEGHPRLVYYLLETFNSILYHQLNENPNLVYAILRSHQDFQTLATFTLLSGLRDIQRRKAVRAAAESDKARESAAPGRGLVRTDSELAMLAEKAALLGREDDDEGAEGEAPLSPGPAVSTQPLTTPGEDHGDPMAAPAATSLTAAAGMSEKARGKMRAQDPAPTSEPDAESSTETDDELMRLAAAGVGPNGYVPTQEWVSSWQKGLPLDPVLVAISEMLPKIQDSQPPRAGGPSSKVLNLLKGADLSDVLPPAPPVIPRKFQRCPGLSLTYQWSPQSRIWLTSLLWGDIYVAGLMSTGVWRDTTVKLFGVKQAPVRARNAQVGRMLKMVGLV